MNNMMFNFNQMGMNNPMIGMNNQQNQMNGMMMDGTAQNIRNIIQPYENKIRELEEIIKQKDFEIIVLKQKLDNNNISNINNINPMMINMNMNPFNIMMGNMNQQKENKGKEIYLKIISENKSKLISCFNTDKASILEKKYNLNEGALTFNYKLIDYDKTISENGIYGGSLIYVAHKIINLEFRDETGAIYLIPLSEDCPISIALIYYYISLGRIYLMMEGIYKDILFYYNGRSFEIGDKTPIKKIFNSTNPIVTVKLLNNLI
jgi:vacuolar-type H+-ATPase subunit F/Vma7